jgi:hypothetical protein
LTALVLPAGWALVDLACEEELDRFCIVKA